MQRILKEHGIKSVQGLSDASAAVSFGALEEAIGQSLMEDDLIEKEPAAEPEEEEYEGSDAEGIEFRFVETEEDILATFRGGGPPARGASGASGGGLDRERLEGVLKELVNCRQLLDRALKDG